MGVGDWLMAAGEAYERYGATGQRTMFVHPNGNVIREAVFAGNPGIAYAPAEDVIRVTQGGGVRPYIREKSEQKWVWRKYRPYPAPLRAAIGWESMEQARSLAERVDVLIEPECKPVGHSNKDWGEANWSDLAARLAACGLRVGRFAYGKPKRREIWEAVDIATATFLDAVAVMAALADRGGVAVLPEGGLHHAAAGVGLRTVVLFGGFISPESTGYAQQVNLFTGAYPCGSRTDCPHCRAAMDRIAPSWVANIVLALCSSNS